MRATFILRSFIYRVAELDRETLCASSQSPGLLGHILVPSSRVHSVIAVINSHSQRPDFYRKADESGLQKELAKWYKPTSTHVVVRIAHLPPFHLVVFFVHSCVTATPKLLTFSSRHDRANGNQVNLPQRR